MQLKARQLFIGCFIILFSVSTILFSLFSGLLSLIKSTFYSFSGSFKMVTPMVDNSSFLYETLSIFSLNMKLLLRQTLFRQSNTSTHRQVSLMYTNSGSFYSMSICESKQSFTCSDYESQSLFKKVFSSSGFTSSMFNSRYSTIFMSLLILMDARQFSKMGMALRSNVVVVKVNSSFSFNVIVVNSSSFLFFGSISDVVLLFSIGNRPCSSGYTPFSLKDSNFSFTLLLFILF